MFSPAPLGKLLTFAGTSYTTQCHRPDPVSGTSGSNNVITKLLVPASAPLHCNAGDIFPPVHPKTFAVYSSGTCPEPRIWAGERERERGADFLCTCTCNVADCCQYETTSDSPESGTDGHSIRQHFNLVDDIRLRPSVFSLHSVVWNRPLSEALNSNSTHMLRELLPGRE